MVRELFIRSLLLTDRCVISMMGCHHFHIIFQTGQKSTLTYNAVQKDGVVNIDSEPDVVALVCEREDSLQLTVNTETNAELLVSRFTNGTFLNGR